MNHTIVFLLANSQALNKSSKSSIKNSKMLLIKFQNAMISLENGLLLQPKNENFSHLPKRPKLPWHRDKSKSSFFSSKIFCQRKDRNAMILIFLASPLMVLVFVLSGSTGLSVFHQGFNQVWIVSLVSLIQTYANTS